MTKKFFEQLNSRAINNKLQDIPNHVFYHVNPAFIVPRHTLVDIINIEMYLSKQKCLIRD